MNYPQQSRLKTDPRRYKFAAAPMEMGLRLAGTVELAAVHAPADYRRAGMILNHGKAMFPSLRTEGSSRWMGRRPCLPDGLPGIGLAPGYRTIYRAFGHAHTGMVGAPHTGRSIAGLLCQQRFNIDISPLRAEHFQS